MAIVKEASCTQCGIPFVWKVERPGDGYWDRWRNDNGDTLASWFQMNNLCYDHAMEKLPEKFRHLLRTESYAEHTQEGD